MKYRVVSTFQPRAHSRHNTLAEACKAAEQLHYEIRRDAEISIHYRGSINRRLCRELIGKTN
jgi:hypothetical protein